jgi:STE24 endopeptidase
MLEAPVLIRGIVLLWIFVWAVERLAELLQYREASKPYPAELSEIQPPAEHERALAYHGERLRLGWAKETIELVAFLAFFLLGGYGIVATQAGAIAQAPWIRATLFVAGLGLLKSLIDFPFAWISTFKLEAKWGFNRTTVRTFLLDRLKGAIIGLLLMAPIFAFALWLLDRGGPNAWLWIWIGYTAFQFFLLWIAPIAILPLFLKLAPLPEGELRHAIETYAARQKFKLDGAWVCDASKRSTKSNAFFTGFGRFRRLVLFDTMIGKLHPSPAAAPNTEITSSAAVTSTVAERIDSPSTPPEERKTLVEEIVAIVAHEAGHFRLGHIWKGSLVSTSVTALVLYLAQRMLEAPDLYLAFGVFPPDSAYGLPLAVMLLGKLGFFASFAASWFSRRNEYAADRFSVETFGNGEALIRGLRHLYVENLAILVQHPFYTALFATHPPLVPRSAAIREAEARRGGGAGALPA